MSGTDPQCSLNLAGVAQSSVDSIYHIWEGLGGISFVYVRDKSSAQKSTDALMSQVVTFSTKPDGKCISSQPWPEPPYAAEKCMCFCVRPRLIHFHLSNITLTEGAIHYVAAFHQSHAQRRSEQKELSRCVNFGADVVCVSTAAGVPI